MLTHPVALLLLLLSLTLGCQLFFVHECQTRNFAAIRLQRFQTNKRQAVYRPTCCGLAQFKLRFVLFYVPLLKFIPCLLSSELMWKVVADHHHNLLRDVI